MKKPSWLLPVILPALLVLAVGAMIGRPITGKHVVISYASASEERTETGHADTAVSAELGKVNINTATVQQLMLLPNIGQTLATRIVDYRTENGTFDTVDDLLFVKGIGSSRLEEIRELITVGG